MTEKNNSQNTGLGDFLAAELQGVIRERQLRSELLRAELEREINKRIASLYQIGDELQTCVNQLQIEMPVADESVDPNAPDLKNREQQRYDSYGNYRFGGGGRGGLPPGLWGW